MPTSAGTIVAEARHASTPTHTTMLQQLDQYLKEIHIGPGTLSMNLSLRTRYEHQQHFTTLSFGRESDDVILSRLRLGLQYQLPTPLNFYIEFQDARYTLSRYNIGEFGRTSPYYDAFDLRQAWIQADSVAGLPIGFKIGRQSIEYANRRLFAPGEWGNVGRLWWDAVSLSYDGAFCALELTYGQRVLTEPHRWNWRHYPWHMGLVALKPKTLPIPLQLFYVIKNDYSEHRDEQGTSGAETRHSIAVYSSKTTEQGWDYSLLAVGQFGHWADDDILAYGGTIQFGYTFAANWKPRIELEFSFGSGDSDPHDGLRQTYDGVFGALDQPYGWMNVVHIQNLQDYAVRLSARPFAKLHCSAEFHLFRLFDPHDAWYWPNGKRINWDPTGGSGSQIGKEIDLLARWQARQNLEVFSGWACFFRDLDSPSLHSLAQTAQWFFLQVSWKY